MGHFFPNGPYSQSESINAAGDWQFDVGSKSHSAGNSSTFSSSGTGTYSYAVTGGSVFGTINEANWSTSSNSETEFNNRGSIGGWSSLGAKTSGTAGGSTRDFVGSGSYSINIPDPTDAKKSAGNVSGKIDEGGSTNANSAESLGWSLSAANGWQQVSGSRSFSNGNSSNSKSSGSGSYSYTDFEDANGIYRSVSHNNKIEEDASNDSGSSASDALMFSAAGVWVRTSGGSSNWSNSHTSSTSSGTGDYTFKVGGTPASPDYKTQKGTLTEDHASLDDQSSSLSTTFTPFGTFVTTGSKSSAASWSDNSSLNGDGSYSRSVTGGSVTGTISYHSLVRGRSVDSTATWALDATGEWSLTGGDQSDSSTNSYNEAWHGSGTYSISDSKTDAAGNVVSSRTISGTVTDTSSHAHDTASTSSSSKVNASGQWEQTSGNRFFSRGSTSGTTKTGTGTYSDNMFGSTTRAVSGTLSESSNSSFESKNSETWVFMKAAFASDMVQTAGVRKLISSSGESFTSDGSGTYSQGLVTNGKISRDYSSKSGSQGESKVENFSGGGWTLTWSGSDSSSQSSDNSYSGSGSSVSDPPVITEPFRTLETHSSGSYEEKFQFQNGNSNSSNWTADATGGKTTTIISSASSLDHRHTATSGGSSSKEVTWYDIPPNPYTAGGKQSLTTEKKESSSNSVTWQVTSNSNSNVTIDASGAVTGGGLRTGSGTADLAMSASNWSRGKNDGPVNKSSVTSTYNKSDNSHDGYASVTTSIGTSAPATLNWVSGNRSSSIHSAVVEQFDMMGNLVVPTNPTPPPSIWSPPPYSTLIFTDGFYTNPFFAQSPPSAPPLPPANPPSGTGSGGNSGGGGGGDNLDYWSSFTQNPVSTWLGQNVVRHVAGDQFLLTTSDNGLIGATVAVSAVAGISFLYGGAIAPFSTCTQVGAFGNAAVLAGLEWAAYKTIGYVANAEATTLDASDLAQTMALGGTFGAAARAVGKWLGIGGCFVAGTTVTLSGIPETARSRRYQFAFTGAGDEEYSFFLPDDSESSLAVHSTENRQHQPIESVPLGARVPTKNPKAWDYDDSLPEPEESTWRKVTFVVSKSDGSIVDIELLRPSSWVESLSLEPGRQLPFRLHELSLDGMATVIDIEPCPMLADGDGSVITGRFITREVAATVRATLAGGSVIEGTHIHPIWSLDRQDWVLLGELEEGEQLQGQYGTVTVTALQVVHRPTRVYNIEVHGEHVYQIGDLGVLVHNAGADCNLIGRIGEALGIDSLALRGWTMIKTLKHGSNGLDGIAQKTIAGKLRTIVVEVKANGSATSALQRLGGEGYAKNVLERLGGLKNLSPGAQVARDTLKDMIKNKEPIHGVVMRLDWRSGTLMETIKRWIPGVR